MQLSSRSLLRQASALVGSAVVVFSLCLGVPTISAAAADAQSYDENQQPLMQPDVRRHTNVIPQEVCDKLVELMEKRGFDLDEEPVDNGEDEKDRKPSQQIDVYKDGEVLEPDLHDVMGPYIDKIAALVTKQRSEELHRIMHPSEPEKLPTIGWIFMRKYAPDSARDSISVHTDSNLHTVNVQLNDGHKGGGLFYVKPPADLNQEWIDKHSSNYEWWDDDEEEYQESPRLRMGGKEYKWADGGECLNTSEVVFPEAELGEAIIHNYTVWHGVAPIDEGARYSLIFFFDEDNPMLESSDDSDDSEDESDDSSDDENDGELDVDEEDETYKL
ncbi:hypothetical protein ACHAWF_014921 [Thalassiosira exigua]